MANRTGKKFGGRQIGTPNKTTIEIKSILTDFVRSNLDTIQQDFDNIKEPQIRLQMMERLLKFILPTNVKEEILQDKDEKHEVIVTFVSSGVPIARREEDVDISRNENKW